MPITESWDGHYIQVYSYLVSNATNPWQLRILLPQLHLYPACSKILDESTDLRAKIATTEISHPNNDILNSIKGEGVYNTATSLTNLRGGEKHEEGGREG